MAVLQAPAKPQPIFRKDYKAPPYLIDTVHLNFILNEDVTHVHSKLMLKPNYAEKGAAPPLFLNGRDDVKLVEVKVAGNNKVYTPAVAGHAARLHGSCLRKSGANIFPCSSTGLSRLRCEVLKAG